MLLLALAVSAVTAVPPQSTSAGSVCSSIQPHLVVERGKAPPMKKLNELPPGNMYKAVYRRIDGCEVPVVVRYDVGRR